MRWIVRIFGALAVAVLLLVGALFLLPGEKIAKVAVDQIRAATGREVKLAGGVEVSFYPIVGVRTGALEIANADWSDAGPMLKAEGLSVGVETMPLLRGEVRIQALELVKPDILLERSKDGRGNWEIGSGGEASGRQMAVSLDRVAVTGGSLRYHDHSDGSRHAFKAVDAVLKVPDLNGRAELELSAAPAGERVQITGFIAQLQPFLDGTPSDLDVSVRAAGGTARFAGRAMATGDAEGQVSVDLPRTGAFLKALDLGAAAPPKGLGQALGLETLAVLKEGKSLALRKMVLKLDSNRLTGDADVGFGGTTPAIKARLSAGALDLSALAASDSGASDGAGWSTDRIDASGLAAVNGQVRLTADAVDLGTITLGASDITTTVDNSRAVFSLNKVAAYGGGFGGQFVINNRSGLSVGGKVSAKQVDMKALLSELAGITRLSGKADATVNFLGVGGSLDAIMKSLKGDGRVSMGRGTISGLDLDKLMRSGDATGGTTVFDALGASFTMAKGDLSNNDLKLTLPGIEATGKGRVGLGARDIDYLFTPVALEARGGRGLAIPVRIKGPWAKPRIIPDLEAAVDLNLAEEKKALEKKVEDKVKAKLKDELGVEVKDGQKVEDALKQKAEDELKKGVLRLLK